MSLLTRPLELWTIPAATLKRHCRGCRRPIYYVKTPNGALMPLSIASEYKGVTTGAFPPLMQLSLFGTPEKLDGKGFAHWADCPNPPARKKKPQPKKK